MEGNQEYPERTLTYTGRTCKLDVERQELSHCEGFNFSTLQYFTGRHGNAMDSDVPNLLIAEIEIQKKLEITLPGLNSTMARRQPSSVLSICMSLILDTNSVSTLRQKKHHTLIIAQLNPDSWTLMFSRCWCIFFSSSSDSTSVCNADRRFILTYTSGFYTEDAPHKRIKRKQDMVKFSERIWVLDCIIAA